MKQSTKDQVEGQLHEAKGAVKEKVGQVIKQTWDGRGRPGRKGNGKGPKEGRPD
jgi:hypothetical protein